MTVSVRLLFLLAVPIGGMNLGRGKGFLAQDLSSCTKEGQEEMILRMSQTGDGHHGKKEHPGADGHDNHHEGPSGKFPKKMQDELKNPPKWPQDPLEDSGAMTFEEVGMAKSFMPGFNTQQFANEIRDTMVCTFKRMTCMSLDDMAAPMDTMLGINAFFAVYDNMSHDDQVKYDDWAKSMRLFVMDPLLNMIYFRFVKPNKDEVESKYKWFPQRVVPSMPSAKAGDWDITEDYSVAGDAYLPVPSGQEAYVWKDASYQPAHTPSLLQMETKADHEQFASTEASLMDNAQKSRRECDERSTEIKKLRCHLDFGKVMLQLAKQMRKFGHVVDLSPEQVKRASESLLEIEDKQTSMLDEAVAKCEADNQTEEN